jgi:hypothetical protein
MGCTGFDPTVVPLLGRTVPATERSPAIASAQERQTDRQAISAMANHTLA